LNSTSLRDGLISDPEPFGADSIVPSSLPLQGKRVGMVVFSSYPDDPRPRRAVEALLQEGMQIDLICEADENQKRREAAGQLNVTRIPIRHIRGGVISYAYQYSTFIFISAVMLAMRTLRHRYDLIYVHNMPDILVFSALVPKLFGAKVILDQHDPMPELMTTIFGKNRQSISVRLLRLLEKFSIGFADLVITVNVACKRIFSSRSCDASKVGVVMNSPSEEVFPYRAAESYGARETTKPFVIMYHGSLVERNGLGLAITAMKLLQATVPEAELRVYGRRSAFLDQEMARARTLGLEGKVRYMGSRKLEDLAGEIESCDIGVVPNLRNEFTEINTPTRIFEYLALGKPVIAPSTLGVCDYFAAESLVFFEAGEPDDLAKQLEFAASHPLELIEIARRGQRIYKKHTWSGERVTLVRLVRDLIAGKSSVETELATPKLN